MKHTLNAVLIVYFNELARTEIGTVVGAKGVEGRDLTIGSAKENYFLVAKREILNCT